MHASWCTEIHVAPASANGGMNSSGLSIIRWQSKMVSGKALRSEATTGGPMVRFGTKCPSMMSTCSSVPPPSSACLACAAKFAKFEERIEGASSTVRGKRVLLRGLLAKNLHRVTPALPMHLAAPRLLEPQFFGHERNCLSHSHSGFADSASLWDCEGRIKFHSPSTNFHRLRNGARAHINREDCETNGKLPYQKGYGNQSNERENESAKAAKHAYEFAPSWVRRSILWAGTRLISY